MKKAFLICVSCLMVVCASSEAASTIKYYTGSYWDLRGWTWKNAAVRFTLPADSAYQLESLNMRLCGDPSATLLDVTIWPDDGGSMGNPLHVFPDQNWNVNNPSDEWNYYDIYSANLVFTPGSSFYAGYTSDASAYADVGVFWDTDVNLGRSSGINIHYGSGWRDIDGELFFEVDVVPVPVPGAVVLGGIGAGFVGYLRRRRTL